MLQEPILHVPQSRQSAQIGKQLVELQLSRIKLLTFEQSSDPLWFILRSFLFTSRTAASFVTKIAADYEKNIKGMSHLLKGTPIMSGSVVLPNDVNEVQDRCDQYWDILLGTINVQKSEVPDPDTAAIEDLKSKTA